MIKFALKDSLHPFSLTNVPLLSFPVQNIKGALTVILYEEFFQIPLGNLFLYIKQDNFFPDTFIPAEEDFLFFQIFT